jgi:tetratricopeptide (TPR) repeat protein
MKRVVRHALTWIKHRKYFVLGGVVVVLVALGIVLFLVLRGPSLEERVAEHPNDKKVLTEVAAEYLERQDYDKARELYGDVLEAEKSNVDAMLGIAAAYVAEAETAETLKRQELREEARKQLRALVASQPSEPRGYIALADLLTHEEGAALLKNALLYLPGDSSLITALEEHEKGE